MQKIESQIQTQIPLNKIADGIFIGDAYSNTENTSVVISTLTEDEYEEYLISNNNQQVSGAKWHRFVVDDDTSENIQQLFFTVHRIIKRVLNEGKQIILHCTEIANYNPILIIAYLMIENNWPVCQAFEYIQTVQLNSCCMKQLNLLEYNMKSAMSATKIH